MKNEIVLKNISINFDRLNILSNISFNIKPGVPTCIIGRGSVGKTSLLKAIIGLIKVSKGQVIINENCNNSEINNKLNNNFGVVFQKDALFDSLNVWQNIMFQSLGKKHKKILITRSKTILKNVGLNPSDAFLLPSELSGGMRKRVAIARAISHDPSFLFLDEPTAGLDPIKSNLIFNIISKQAINRGITLLAVTSDMKGALKYFEKIIVIEEKKVHWIGTRNMAMRKPTKLMKKLFEKI